MFQAGHNDGERRGARTELEKGNGWRNMQHSSFHAPKDLKPPLNVAASALNPKFFTAWLPRSIVESLQWTL